METREIVLACTDEGVVVIYNTTLTDEEITKWCTKAGCHVNDVFAEKQDQLQYYCIDARYWMDEKKDNDIREWIKD